MFADIAFLRNFYQTALGQRTQRIMRARLESLWPRRGAEERVLTLGYGVPLLPCFAPRSAFACMPAGQGVSIWPDEGANLSVLADTGHLPLPDALFDRAVLLHALEGVSDPGAVLSEVWRALKGGGKLLLIVPNRRGFWAHSDLTPFGCGQPYSADQLRTVLEDNGFFVERTVFALFAPPRMFRGRLFCGDKIEAIASKLFPGLGGIVMVEASKQYGVPTAVKAKSRGLVFPLPFIEPQAFPS